jgi:myo-inositol 2-dehydrogenase/D-chiro-inositol 1-dehydrogenase
MTKELRIGVIGVGEIGRSHIEKIVSRIPYAHITAISDVNEEYAIKTANTYGVRFERDPHSLIASADVDAVIVACWDKHHEEYVTSCITKNKYVFCEKPLSDTSEACKRIMNIETAGAKRLLSVGFMRRFDKSYVLLKEVIQSGAIGAPLIVHEQHRNLAPLGDDKFTTERLISNALPHELDVTRWLLDDEYETVQFIAPKRTRNADADCSDPQIVILRTRSGIHIDVEIFMNAHYGYDIQCEVVGEEGTARLQDPSNLILKSNQSRSYGIAADWRDRFDTAYETELRTWIDGVIEGKATGPSAWDGYIAAFVAEACNESRLRQKIISLEYESRPKQYEEQEMN